MAQQVDATGCNLPRICAVYVYAGGVIIHWIIIVSSTPEDGLSTLDYHVLLALAEGPLHGYAIRDAVELESEGALAPRAGSLYRVIARLISAGWVAETETETAVAHPGRPRRYYALSREGRRTLADEARRLEGAAALALDRLGLGTRS